MSQKRVIDLKEALARRAAPPEVVVPEQPARNIFLPDPNEADDDARPDPIGLSPAAFLKYSQEGDGEGVRMLGPAFFNAPDVPNFTSLTGVKILMGKPIYQLIRAVAEDDLGAVMSLKLVKTDAIVWATQVKPYLNQPTFFFWRGSSDAAFITPAHACRSLEMAMYLSKHLGVRFDVPDSEGRLPQLYWAIHATDHSLFSYGEQMLGMDMARSGARPDVKDEAFVQPIWRAIEVNNPVAVKGLGLCATAAINRPRPNDWGQYTPLMIQTVKADNAIRRQDTVRLQGVFKTVSALARSPNIAWDATDWEGFTLDDFPLHTRIRTLIDASRANPWPHTCLKAG